MSSTTIGIGSVKDNTTTSVTPVLQYYNKSDDTQPSLNIVTLNLMQQGSAALPQLLHLMASLKIHIMALQDVGYFNKTLESKQQYGDYKVFYYKFSEKTNDTLAFLLDEGIYHHVIKERLVTERPDAHSYILTIPNILDEEQSLHIVNTYAPAKNNLKKQYVRNLIKMLRELKLTPQNTMIVGDMNDYISPQLDRWSTKTAKTTGSNKGDILNPLKQEKYQDVFRKMYPESRMFSRIGMYQTNKTTKITRTRLDYILTGVELIHKTLCCTILENYEVGSDHRPVLLILKTNKKYLHVAGSVAETDATQPKAQLTDQPPTKYVLHKQDDDKWAEFQKLVQQEFHTQPTFQKIPISNQEIEDWTNQFNKTLDLDIANTVQWQDTSLKQNDTTATDCNVSQESQTANKTKIANTYFMPKLDGKPMKLTNLPHKAKLNHQLFKQANYLKQVIGQINSVFLTYLLKKGKLLMICPI